MWKEEFPYRTKQDLERHRWNILKTVKDYYNNLFLVENGDNYTVRQYAKAAHVLIQCF